jgi:hypothetical protein
MVDVKEQHACIKFCFKLGKSAAKTQQVIKQAPGDEALGQMQTCDWCNRIKNGRTSVDDERCGRPSTGTMPKNVAKVREVICEDHRRTIPDVCNILVVIWNMPVHFVRQTQHEADCCKIRAKAAD